MITKNSIKIKSENLNALVRAFYALPNCFTGGPLYKILHSGCILDSDLVFCYRNLHKSSIDEFTRKLGLIILHELFMFNEAQRYLWYTNSSYDEAFKARNAKLIITNGNYKVIYK